MRLTRKQTRREARVRGVRGSRPTRMRTSRQQPGQKAQIGKAIEALIADHGLTYRQAARRYGVSVNQLRARINYRHGSLANARLYKDCEQKTWTRPCLCCADQTPRPKGQYRCNRCIAGAESLYEGKV